MFVWEVGVGLVVGVGFGLPVCCVGLGGASASVVVWMVVVSPEEKLNNNVYCLNINQQLSWIWQTVWGDSHIDTLPGRIECSWIRINIAERPTNFSYLSWIEKKKIY